MQSGLVQGMRFRMDICIQRARSSDARAIADLYTALDRFHAKACPSIFREAVPSFRTESYFAELDAWNDRTIFIATCEQQAIGFADLRIRKAPDVAIFQERQYVDVDGLFVVEEYRRRGVAKQLLEAVMGWTKSTGLSRIELSVYAFNDSARSFYEKHRFLPLRTTMFRED